MFAIASSVLLAEVGDKTMLATVALASDHNWAGVWAGAMVGMVLADGVAIAVGTVLHRRLPEHVLHAAAGVLFLGFGLWTLLDTALGWHTAALAATGALGLVAGTAAGLALRPGARNRAAGAAPPPAAPAKSTR